MNKALDEVRAGESRRMASEEPSDAVNYTVGRFVRVAKNALQVGSSPRVPRQFSGGFSRLLKGAGSPGAAIRYDRVGKLSARVFSNSYG